MKTRLTPLAAAALAASALALGTPALADQATKHPKAATRVSSGAVSAPNFAIQAQHANLFEVEASRIAVQRAQSAEVRQYATQMIEQHTRAANELSGAAQQAGIAPTSVKLDSAHVAKLRELRDASDGAFDAAYIAMQIQAHETTLALHRHYAEAGDKVPLKATAQRMVPVVQQHLGEAGKLSVQLPKH